ncbi:MAG: response regulator receiver [Bacteroidetes bacterium]|nr:response regulator receiver [Bacteroidota bacterium]
MKRSTPKYKYNNALLIDDNELDNFINERMLEANSFARKIYNCTNGKSALEFLNNIIASGSHENGINPDIMFVDLDMPIMDGFAFIENFMKIKHKGLENCKIVILTSSINIDDKTKAEKMDLKICFVNKPLTDLILSEL